MGFRKAIIISMQRHIHLLLFLLTLQLACGIPATYKMGFIIMLSYYESDGALTTCCKAQLGSTNFTVLVTENKTILNLSIKGAKLALDNINNNSSFFPNGPQLEVEFVDDQFSPAVGLKEMIDFQQQGIQIVLGQATSFVSTTTAKAATVFGMIQQSYAATSPSLSDRITYKYFSRILPPDDFQVNAMMALLSNLSEKTGQVQWREVAIISTTDAYGLGLANAFINDHHAKNFEVMGFQQFIPGAIDISVEMQEMKQTKSRVFFACLLFSDWETVVNSAIELEIIGDTHIWLCPDGCTTVDSYTTNNEIDYVEVAAMTGMLGTQPYSVDPEEPAYAAYLERWAQLDPEIYPGGGDVTNLDIFALTSYDMIYFMATALKHMIEDGVLDEDGHFDPDVAVDYIRNTTIDGLTGNIVLNANSERFGIYNILNFIPEKGYWAKIGSYDEITGLNLEEEIIWHDNTTNIPDIDIRTPFDYWSCEEKKEKTDRTGKKIVLEKPDKDHVKYIDVDYHCDQFIDCWNLSDESVECGSNYLALFIVFGIITGILILIAILSIVFTIVFGYIIRRRRVRAASPPFQLLLSFSVIVGFASTFAWYGKPHPVACGFQPWLLGLSVVSMISALIAKKFRIWRIFSSPFKKKSIKDLELLILWVILMIPALVILIIWTIVSTPTATMKEFDNVDHYVCDTGGFTGPPGGYVFFFILVGYEAIVLLFGAFLSVVTRKVPALYNESKLLAISIYNLLFLAIIVIPVCIVLGFFNPFAAWIIRTVAILYAFAATLALQYVPLIVYITIIDRCKELDLQRLGQSTTDSRYSSTAE